MNLRSLKQELLIAIINHKEKRGYLGSETQKMISCEPCNCSACGCRIFSVKFEQSFPNKRNHDCRNDVCNNINGDFPRDDFVRNMLEEKSATCQGLICAKILPLHVLLPPPPG